MTEHPNLAELLEEALLAVDAVRAGELLAAAGTGVAAVRVVDDVMAPALERIGQKWERGEAALSQVYMSGRICEALTAKLLPPADPERDTGPKLGIVVLEDFHFLGKDLVKSALRAAGFDPVDLGHADVGGAVQRALAERIEILLISTLMLPSALKVREVRTQLDAVGASVRIVVGGAPFRFDPLLWKEVGADACGQNALDAIRIVRRLRRQARPQRSNP